MEQHLERRQQRRINAGALGLAQRGQLAGQLVGQIEAPRCAAIGLHRRTRPIGRQIERRQRPGQVLAPVVPQPLAFLSREHLLLPEREIAIRRRSRGSAAGWPVTSCR